MFRLRFRRWVFAEWPVSGFSFPFSVLFCRCFCFLLALHHLVGHSIGLLFVLIARLADGELGLNDRFVKERLTLYCAITACKEETGLAVFQNVSSLSPWKKGFCSSFTSWWCLAVAVDLVGLVTFIENFSFRKKDYLFFIPIPPATFLSSRGV